MRVGFCHKYMFFIPPLQARKGKVNGLCTLDFYDFHCFSIVFIGFFTDSACFLWFFIHFHLFFNEFYTFAYSMGGAQFLTPLQARKQ